MPSENDSVSTDRQIAELDYETFKNVIDDVIDAYGKRIIRLVLSGPRYGARIDEKFAKMLVKKHDIEKKTLKLMIRGLLTGFHYLLAGEYEYVLDEMKQKEGEEAANLFKRKVDLVKDIARTHPEIEQSYRAYTHTVMNFFDDLEWEVGFRCADSYASDTDVLPAASAKIKITSTKYATSPIEERTQPLLFVISPPDLDYMIKSLQNLRESLSKLEKKELR